MQIVHGVEMVDKKVLCLTRNQEAILLDQIIRENISCYNIGMSVCLLGDLDVLLFSSAIGHVIQVQDAMRLQLVNDRGETKQRLTSVGAYHIPILDLSADTEDDDQINDAIEQFFEHKFELYNALLWRMQLIKTSNEKFIWLFCGHHTVFDGLSFSIITQSVTEHYNQLARKERIEQKTTQLNYCDYIQDYLKYQESPRFDKDKKYWLDKYTQRLEPLWSKKHDVFDLEHIQNYSLFVKRKRYDALKLLAEQFETSVSQLLTVVFGLCFSKISNHQSSIVIGSMVHNRTTHWQKQTAGFFTSIVPAFIQIQKDATLQSQINELASQLGSACWYQRYPTMSLLRDLREAGQQHEQLFDIMFSMHSFDGELNFHDVQSFAFIPRGNHSAQTALTIWVADYDERDDVEICCSYNPCVMNRNELIRYVQGFDLLLDSVLQFPDRPFCEFDVLLPDERDLLLRQFNATSKDYPKDKVIHELFEAQAVSHPHAIAVEYEDQRLSYQHLNERANQLAHYLVAQGIKPDDRVAICVERSLEMVVAILATLKAGGAYVPLDPNYPTDRLLHMVSDSAPKVLLTQNKLHTQVSSLIESSQTRMMVLHLDDEKDPVLWQGLSIENIPKEDLQLTPNHLAYLIYTSGSTGLPKGVMLPHQGVANYILSAIDLFGITCQDKVLQQNSINFDLSVEEMFPALLNGATLKLTNTIFGSDPALLDTDITVVHFTAAHWHSLVGEWKEQPQKAQQDLKSLRLINVTGDALSNEKVRDWEALIPHPITLINTYGPTETSVSCTAQEARYQTQQINQSIGRPMGNVAIYILDAHLNPVPIGVAGEIYIGGAGVARGYLNRPELTAERFLEDPFADQSQYPNARMYKSGDLGRWLPDGTIECLGRNDFQVKIRGFRIELGEIEAKLSACSGIKEAVVIAREDEPGQKRLVAYYVPSHVQSSEEGALVDAASLRQSLAKDLAEHMIPSAFVALEKFPLTPNGKLDRKALPAPEGDAFASPAYEAPQGEIEETLAQIWQELLKVDKVGRHDNFFVLGGHSLLALQLIAKVNTTLNKQIDLRNVFIHPTIQQLADLIQDKAQQKKCVTCLVPIREVENGISLFLVHPGGGNIEYVGELAAYLSGDISVYGIAARGILEGEDIFSSYEEMIEAYLVAIKSVQAHGPYYFGGYSLGGMIAYDLAHRLMRQGETINFLASIDGSNPNEVVWGDLSKYSDESVLSWLYRDYLSDLNKKLFDQAMENFNVIKMIEICKSESLISNVVSLHDVQKYLKVPYSVGSITADYYRCNKLKPSNLPLHLFVASKNKQSNMLPDLGWMKLTDAIQINFYACDHREIVSFPHIQQLGLEISKEIKQAHEMSKIKNLKAQQKELISSAQQERDI